MSEPRNCRSCYYRNTTWIGNVEASADCDHPEFVSAGRSLTLTEFQAPEWCPLGVAQPLKRDTLIDLPANPTVQENPDLKQALLDWATRGNMTHKDAPSDLERAVQFGAESIREAEDKRILDEMHARSAEACPRCGSPTQTTPLTPPDEGVAYGCTRCSWPTGETP